MKGKVPVIAVDGPAAAGKGTLSKGLAGVFGLPHLDTGLLYRGVAKKLLNAGGDPKDATRAEEMARSLIASDLARNDLRGPEVDRAASAIASLAGVRLALLDFQRAFPGDRGAVLDGRDIGTVIFPSAAAKLWVTARPEIRAQRRWLELSLKGLDVEFSRVLNWINERDQENQSRKIAPMVPAKDAKTIDTSNLNRVQTLANAVKIIWKKLPVELTENRQEFLVLANDIVAGNANAIKNFAQKAGIWQQQN